MLASENVSQETEKAEIVYKTKTVQFLGRSVPIILQNDNGPCPLLAICNVLLLRNNISLGVDIPEIASSRLLSLVAERLIDSNINIQGKNEEYARNQQQNISDALSLLPQLVTGLDVNVRFRNIQDFEFTPNCAVFDLLDIGLVHGWLCDPQDEVTSKILSPHSYNTLVERLVKLQATKADLQAAASADSIDFAAATKATLGVPSPSRAVLLKTNSFENQDASKVIDCLQQKSGVDENPQLQRKGDVEENAKLLEALQVSEAEVLRMAEQEQKTATIPEDSVAFLAGVNNPISAGGNESFTVRNSKEDLYLVPPDADLKTLQAVPRLSETIECSQLDSGGGHETTGSLESVKDRESDENKVDSKAAATDSLLPVSGNDGPASPSIEGHLKVLDLEARTHSLCISEDLTKGEDSVEHEVKDCENSHVSEHEVIDHENSHVAEHEVIDHENLSRPLGSSVDLGVSSGSFVPSSEPLYEGEAEASAGACAFETREPLYEGEANLVECEHQIGAVEEGAIISSFLKSNATQLTYYGLFCLQEGLNERELCVFFRNNHFSTIFKYQGGLYLLVTDQGYLNQPDIVWEKLEEVHGDTVFVTGNFTPFQAGENSGFWDEQGAIAATADYLSSQQQSSSTGAKDMGVNNLDLELAMSLQHKEFELQQQQQHQQHQQQQQQQPRTVPLKQSQAMDSTMRADGNRLITGPKKSSYTHKPETKSKCAIM